MLCVSGYVRGYIAPNIFVLYSAWSTPVALSTSVSSVDSVKVICYGIPNSHGKSLVYIKLLPIG